MTFGVMAGKKDETVARCLIELISITRDYNSFRSGFYLISMPTQDSPASISRLPPRPLSSPPSGRSFSRTSMNSALPSRRSQSECGRLSRISPNSESASDHNAIQPNQTVFESAALLDVRGGRRELEEWWRLHSVEEVAASSQEGDRALTKLDRLDMITAHPIGTNLTVVSHAFVQITATGDDRPRSVNRSYPHGSHAHSPK
jgi:hypothetical protein